MTKLKTIPFSELRAGDNICAMAESFRIGEDIAYAAIELPRNNAYRGVIYTTNAPDGIDTVRPFASDLSKQLARLVGKETMFYYGTVLSVETPDVPQEWIPVYVVRLVNGRSVIMPPKGVVVIAYEA